jgi:hypothetical protein
MNLGDNDLTGPVVSSICSAVVVNQVQLAADCNEVECNCCALCCVDEGQCETNNGE